MGRAAYLIAAIFSGLLVGILSAINALGSYGLLPVIGQPSWAEWQLSGGDTKLIYSLGHFLSEGQLPPPKLARSFVRNVDNDGNRLSDGCVYLVEGKVTPARWWTLSAGQSNGLSARSELSAGEAIVDKDGTLRVFVSQHPMPGNWIQPNSGSFTLHYIINEAPNGATIQLPNVSKKGC